MQKTRKILDKPASGGQARMTETGNYVIDYGVTLMKLQGERLSI